MEVYFKRIMATLYTQTSSNTSGNFNWNAANDNYAWSFVAATTWIPNQLVLNVASITGTPVGNFYIKADKTAASATYGSASWVTLASGDNTITLTGGATITAWGTYWVYFERTTNTSNVPSISYDSWKTNYPVYRSASSNIDPATSWFTNDIRMSINGTLVQSSWILFF